MADGNPYAVNMGQPLTRAVQGYMMGQQFAQQQADRRRQQQARQFAQPAMMGDPGALAQLMSLDPQLGQQVQMQQMQQAQMRARQQQAAAEQAAAKQKMRAEFDESFSSMVFDLGKIKPENRKAYVDQMQQRLMAQYPDTYKQLSKQYLLDNPADRQQLVDIFQEIGSDESEVKVGRFRYIETPEGFLKVDTSTGQQEEIKLGSKEAEAAEAERQKAAEKLLEEEQTTFQRAEKLRKEYNTRSKEFFSVRDAFNRVEASVTDPDPAGDIALIFNYMKMLDPASVVREGEFATAQNAGSVAESVYNLYNRVLEGTRLTDKQRNMFKGRAEKLFDKANEQNKKDRQQILDLGRRYNLTDQDIFGKPEETEQERDLTPPPMLQRLPEEGVTTEATTQPKIVDWGSL